LQIYIIGVSEQTKCAFPLPEKITVATIWWKTLAGRTRMLTKTTFSCKSHSELMILFGANLSIVAQIHLPVVAKLQSICHQQIARHEVDVKAPSGVLPLNTRNMMYFY